MLFFFIRSEICARARWLLLTAQKFQLLLDYSRTIEVCYLLLASIRLVELRGEWAIVNRLD
jgi:hypothetical protein